MRAIAVEGKTARASMGRRPICLRRSTKPAPSCSAQTEVDGKTNDHRIHRVHPAAGPARPGQQGGTADALHRPRRAPLTRRLLARKGRLAARTQPAESRMEVRVAGPSRLRRRLRAAAVSGSSRRWWSPRFRGPRRSPPSRWSRFSMTRRCCSPCRKHPAGQRGDRALAPAQPYLGLPPHAGSTGYIAHYKSHRPHRSLHQHPPAGPTPPPRGDTR
jgi:hypothetical protein